MRPGASAGIDLNAQHPSAYKPLKVILDFDDPFSERLGCTAQP